MTKKESTFGALIFLFSAVALFVLSSAGRHSLGRFEEYFSRQRELEIQKKLDRAVAFSTREFFLHRVLTNLVNVTRRHGTRSFAFRRMMALLKGYWKTDLEVFIFRNFQPICISSPNPQNAEIYGKILRGISLRGKAFYDAQRELKPEIDRVLGEGNRLELLKRWQKGLIGMGEHDKKVGCLGNFPEGIGVFCLIASYPDPVERFLKVPEEWRSGVGFVDFKTDRWLPPDNLGTDQMKIAWQSFQDECGKSVFFAGRDWIFCRNKRGQAWCIADSGTGFPELSIAGNLVSAGFGFSIIIFITFILIYFDTGPGLALSRILGSVSIRYQFYLLFFLASILPLGIALLVGAIGIIDREEVLVGEAGNRNNRLILSLEHYRYAVQEEFVNLALRLRNSGMVRELQMGPLASLTMDLIDKEELQRIEVRDSAGNALFTNWDPLVHGSGWALEMFTKVAIRRHAPQRLGERMDKISAQELVSESLMTSINTGMTEPLQTPGKVWTFRMGGGSPPIWFWDVYPDPPAQIYSTKGDIASGPAYFSVATQLGWIFQRKLFKLLHREKPGPNYIRGTMFGKIGKTDAYFLPQISGKDIQEMMMAGSRVQETDEKAFREFELEGGKYWVTIKKETFLSGRLFFSMIPVASQLELLSPLKWRLLAMALVGLTLAFLAARLLSRLFLLPIADLTGGIDAIQKRNDAYRIPLRRLDEFGVVVSAFNRLLTELKELQYGRVVQESLLPSKVTAPQGYEIECFRCPATDLAGDYHDVFFLPDGRWVCIIGDVTGHGISAALAMAMAKATVGFQKISGWTFPGEVMVNLNRLFHKELKPRNKLMTLACLVVDPSTHHGVFENAGHPYPYLFQMETQSVMELEAPGFPLGARKTRTVKPVEFQMNVGDSFLLFTDGYTECTNCTDDQFGYLEIKRIFGDLQRKALSSKETLRELMRILDEFRAPGPYPDDVTLVMIKRIS